MEQSDNQKRKVRSVVGTILMAVALMWLLPYGSFDPTKSGFYISIVIALGTALITSYLLRRFRVK